MDESIVMEKLNQMSDKLNDIHVIVTGNGNPENGLVVKLARCDEQTKANCSRLKIISGKLWALIFILVSSALGYGLSLIF